MNNYRKKNEMNDYMVVIIKWYKESVIIHLLVSLLKKCWWLHIYITLFVLMQILTSIRTISKTHVMYFAPNFFNYSSFIQNLPILGALW